MKKGFTSIDQYIRSFPKEVQGKLTGMRRLIRKQAPMAEEKISYQIPTFFLNGNLVHFACYARHIGFYPGAEAVKVFGKDLSRYKTAKGSVQFPIGEPLPAELIRKIVKFRVSKNLKKKA